MNHTNDIAVPRDTNSASRRAALPAGSKSDNLVRMTRSVDSGKPSRCAAPPPGHWLLQDAKARFSELVRRVHSEGPQHVTVHGRDEVVVIAAEDFRRLQGAQTGKALVEVLRACPLRGTQIPLASSKRSTVRDVKL